jgi:hypothetical protein
MARALLARCAGSSAGSDPRTELIRKRSAAIPIGSSLAIVFHALPQRGTDVRATRHPRRSTHGARKEDARYTLSDERTDLQAHWP